MNLIPRRHFAEFQGPDALAAAGQAVLDDLNLDMAIVRDAVDWPEAGEPLTEERYDETGYRLLPGLFALDATVEAWGTSHEYIFRPMHRDKCAIFYAARRTNGAPRHYDSIDLGPVSLSVRTDRNEGQKRIFGARRFTVPTYDKIGLNIEELRLGAMKEAVRMSKFTRIRQHPGDVVVIPNNPFPAAHNVETTDSATEALILSYVNSFSETRRQGHEPTLLR